MHEHMGLIVLGLAVLLPGLIGLQILDVQHMWLAKTAVVIGIASVLYGLILFLRII